MDTYEKSYKDALQKAKKLYEQGTITESLSYVFPELKGSEDERIKKSIIAIINNYVDDSNTFKPKMLAWLEKQGKQKWSEVDERRSDETIELLEYFNNYAPEFRRPAIRRSINWIKSLKHHDGMSCGMITPEESLGISSEKYNEIVNECIFGDDKKPQVDGFDAKLKVSEDERIRKGLVKAVSGTLEGNKLFGTNVTREEALAWLEKQGDQNTLLDELEMTLSVSEDAYLRSNLEKLIKEFKEKQQ